MKGTRSTSHNFSGVPDWGDARTLVSTVGFQNSILIAEGGPRYTPTFFKAHCLELNALWVELTKFFSFSRLHFECVGVRKTRGNVG